MKAIYIVFFLFFIHIICKAGAVLTFEIPSCEVINDVKNTENLKLEIYPNPSNGIIQIFLNKQFSGLVNIEIFNITGQKVFNQEYNFTSDNNSLILDVKVLITGVYFLTVNHKDLTVNQKLIIR
ncbi:MAG: T9SS C-terminal target domain-containing protein [Chitinophagaceae bacterium]|nr:MAG: T9SS C-terminal target domain-containing protein [Chitinophagaceae bacterium]